MEEGRPGILAGLSRVAELPGDTGYHNLGWHQSLDHVILPEAGRYQELMG